MIYKKTIQTGFIGQNLFGTKYYKYCYTIYLFLGIIPIYINREQIN